jgi:hypothetical protein
MSLPTNYLSEDNITSNHYPDLLSKFSKKPKVIRSIKGDIHLPVFKDEMFAEFILQKEIYIEQTKSHTERFDENQIIQRETHVSVIRENCEEIKEVTQVEYNEEQTSISKFI